MKPATMGESSVAISAEQYRHIPYDPTLNLAGLSAQRNRQMPFCHVTDAGSDRSKQRRIARARVEKRYRKRLAAVAQESYMFEAGVHVVRLGASRRQAAVMREKGEDVQAKRSVRWMVAWTLRALNRTAEALETQSRLQCEREAAGARRAGAALSCQRRPEACRSLQRVADVPRLDRVRRSAKSARASTKIEVKAAARLDVRTFMPTDLFRLTPWTICNKSSGPQ